jgi:hypothetical protein
MRQGQNGRRNNRGRGPTRGPGGVSQGGGGGGRNDQRVRGNAHQLVEKFKNLARDAALAGDRILSEWYLQHADHYQRILNERNAERARFEEQRYGGQRRGSEHDFVDDGDDEGEDAPMQPAGFGAAAAVSAFGVDGVASAGASESGEGGDDGEGADDEAEDNGDEGEAEMAAEDAQADDQPQRRRRRRGRGGRNGPRDFADAPAPETAE